MNRSDKKKINIPIKIPINLANVDNFVICSVLIYNEVVLLDSNAITNSPKGPSKKIIVVIFLIVDIII